MSFKNSIVSFPAPFLSVVSPQAVCSFDAMHKGKLPQFKRHKAFGQYKNRTAGGTYLASPLHRSVHKFPVVLSLLIWGIKIPPNRYWLVVLFCVFPTIHFFTPFFFLFNVLFQFFKSSFRILHRTIVIFLAHYNFLHFIP